MFCVWYTYTVYGIPDIYQIRMCWQPVLRKTHFALYSEKLQASLDLYEQGPTVGEHICKPRILETPAVYSKFLFVYINWYM